MVFRCTGNTLIFFGAERAINIISLKSEKIFFNILPDFAIFDAPLLIENALVQRRKKISVFPVHLNTISQNSKAELKKSVLLAHPNVHSNRIGHPTGHDRDCSQSDLYTLLFPPFSGSQRLHACDLVESEKLCGTVGLNSLTGLLI